MARIADAKARWLANRPAQRAQLVNLSVPLGIPTGTHVYMQAAMVAGATPASIVTSNGLDLLVNPN